VVEITSAIMTEKKLARLPLVMRNTKSTKADPMMPDIRLTAIGVPTLANRPIHAGAAPSSAAMAWVRSAPSSQTAPLPRSVRTIRIPNTTFRPWEWKTPATAL